MIIHWDVSSLFVSEYQNQSPLSNQYKDHPKNLHVNADVLVYTWNLFVLYFGDWSFGFQVFTYLLYVFCFPSFGSTIMFGPGLPLTKKTLPIAGIDIFRKGAVVEGEEHGLQPRHVPRLRSKRVVVHWGLESLRPASGGGCCCCLFFFQNLIFVGWIRVKKIGKKTMGMFKNIL